MGKNHLRDLMYLVYDILGRYFVSAGFVESFLR